ncbi:MAG TPA: phosphodiester glycosidase family protein, partial [Solirubrobacteraceae bacterium]|nr:phosphodiester glycosidase family protein [Solirubrobacteraceae bacterium]
MRRVILLAAAMCLVPSFISYAAYMAQPSNSSFFINSVEWLRGNGARGIVNSIENFYYSLNAPPKGGPALHRLPNQRGGAVALTKILPQHYEPPRIKPVIHPALPGEGVWHATFANGGRYPPVLITSFRPQAAYPQLVAGVAWIDHTRTTTWLYPGMQEPAVALPDRGPEEVPPQLRSHLVATFNSGFKLADSNGGVVISGHTYAPLRDGMGTILRYRNGQINVIDWTGGSIAGPNVVYARQNLPLIVDNGKPNPNLSDGPQWGATLGNAIQVWRSAVGVDRHGNLIYAAANYQTVGSLAAIMIRAGAVRAMELDINTYWTSFISYRYPGGRDPANLLADMDRSPFRYLTPDDRDFFAVYVR